MRRVIILGLGLVPDAALPLLTSCKYAAKNMEQVERSKSVQRPLTGLVSGRYHRIPVALADGITRAHLPRGRGLIAARRCWASDRLCYIATRIDGDGLRSFEWCLHHVLRVACENGLPMMYRAEIAAVPARSDSDPGRRERELAVYR